MHGQCKLEVIVKRALHKLWQPAILIMVNQHEREIARRELLARVVRQVCSDYAIALLLADHAKCFWAAIERLSQSEWEKVVKLVLKVDSCRADWVVGATLVIYRNTRTLEAHKVLCQFDPKLPWRQWCIVFAFLTWAELMTFSWVAQGRLFFRMVVFQVHQVNHVLAVTVLKFFEIEYFIISFSFNSIVWFKFILLPGFADERVASFEGTWDAMPALHCLDGVGVPAAALEKLHVAVVYVFGRNASQMDS